MITVKKQMPVLIITVLICAGLSAAAFPADDPDSLLVKGRAFYDNGEFEQAGMMWKNALEASDPEKSPGICLDTAVYLTGVYRMTGYQQRALTLLHHWLPVAEKSSDPDRKALFFSTLADIYLSLGDIVNAVTYAEKAVESGREGKNPLILANVLLDVGNVLSADGNYEAADGAYGECLALIDANEENDPDSRLQFLKSKVLINAARVLFLTGQYEESGNALEYAAIHMSDLPDSLEKARDLMALALLLRDAQNLAEERDETLDMLAYRTLTLAREIAEKYKDSRCLSQTYGYTGELYEKQKQWEDALKLTRSAVFFSRQGDHKDILYLWQWQMGRIYEAMGKEEAALQSYSDAVATLTPIRKMLFSGYRSGRDTFSERIRPVYLNMAGLLLKQAADITDESVRQEKLRRARDTMEILKSAELEDFFEDECVTALKNKTETLDKTPEHTAFLYPIMLPDRLVVLLTLPDGMDQVTVNVGAEKITESVLRFRLRLQTRPNNRFLYEAGELYDWIIRPIEDRLKKNNIDTLVFAPDGALRQIPFATLYDGIQFLVEKYAIATVPAVTLTDPKPLGESGNPSIFLGGISEAVQDFSPLPSVTAELRDIKEIMDGRVLLQNKEYTLNNLTQQFKNNEYTIVHLATHGVFGGSPEESFVLTYDDKMTMNHLEELISYGRFRENQVQLLTLSACQTALGDERAALGLAGVAVKAGVRSAVATLWYVDDEATSLAIREFYRQLRIPGLSKAKALQNAQKSLIRQLRFRHPGYWGPFLLIGNWM